MKLSKKFLLAVFSSGFIALSNPVYAENMTAQNNTTNTAKTTESNIAKLTLFDAIDTAVQNNYSLKIAEEKIKAARYLITQNSAQGLPQVTINTSYGRQDPVNAAASSGNNSLASNPQFASFLGTARVNTFNNQVAVSQILFAGFRVVDGIKLANVNVDLSQESFRQSRQDVVSNVSIAYYNALKAAQLIDVNTDALKQASLHLEQAQKLEKAGVGIKLDVVKANNQLVNTQLQLSQSINSYEKAKKSLNLAMGRSVDYPIELDTKASTPDIKTDDEKMVQDALKNRSELKQLNLKKQMDEITTTIQSRATWPTISANISYNLSDTTVVDSNSNNQQNIKYGLNMNWPIFDGLLTYSKVQSAQNTVIQDQISIDQLQQSIILDMRQALLDIKDAHERIILAKNSISLANDALKIAQIRYDNGVGISLDVLDAQNSYTQAQANLINAQFDLNIGRVKLYRAMGVDI